MKILRVLIRTLFIIPLAAILYLVILINMLLNPPACCQNFSQAKPYRWNKVKLGSNVMSSDGSSYHMYSKRGVNNNLIIYFSGGGMVWDASSAFSPMGITSLVRKNIIGYYFSNIPIYTLISLRGMFDNKKAENPFHGWNIVYIPYSTGDMHIGNCIAQYTNKSRTKVVHHNGMNNVFACFNWIFKSFGNPGKVVVCGDSAGAFAAPYWAKTLAKHYSNSDVYCLSDGAFLKSKSWPSIINGTWKTRFEDTFGYKPTDDPLAEAFIDCGRISENPIIMMHANTLYDKTLATYQADINNDPVIGNNYIDKWSQGMLDSVKLISRNSSCYHFYITKFGYRKIRHFTPHTLTRYPRFYKVTESNVLFTKWLDDIINKGIRYDVGAKYLADK